MPLTPEQIAKYIKYREELGLPISPDQINPRRAAIELAQWWLEEHYPGQVLMLTTETLNLLFPDNR